MSHIASVWAWKQSVENPLRKLILLHMADSVSEQNNWQSWYSLNKIAERCDCSRGSARNHLKALVEMDYLTIMKASDSTGKPTVYRLNVGSVEVQIGPSLEGDAPNVPRTGDDQGGAGDVRGGATDVRVGVQQMYGGGTSLVPKPVNELVTKPESKPVKKNQSSKFIPPSWMPSDKWNMYLVSRKEKKHPMNAASLGMCVNAISGCVAEGWSVDVVMDHMIEAGWRTAKTGWLKESSGNGTKTNGHAKESHQERGERMAREREARINGNQTQEVISEQ